MENNSDWEDAGNNRIRLAGRFPYPKGTAKMYFRYKSNPSIVGEGIMTIK